jgi:hypothetical protein
LLISSASVVRQSCGEGVLMAEVVGVFSATGEMIVMSRRESTRTYRQLFTGCSQATMLRPGANLRPQSAVDKSRRPGVD